MKTKMKKENRMTKANIVGKMSKLMFCVAIAAPTSLVAQAETNTNQQVEVPQGKVIVTMFGNVGATINTDGNAVAAGFELERAYLGYQYKLNSKWAAKVVYDMGRGDDTQLQRLGYVKNAEVSYKTKKLAINAGLTSTKQFGIQEKFWAFRYVQKSFQDQYKWGSSADLGITASYKIANWFQADLSIFNGEGYKKVQSDKKLLYGLGITLLPIENLTIRAYADIKPANDKTEQINMALFAGYNAEKFRVGVEYNKQFNNKNISNNNLEGVSVYGAALLGENSEVFARFDNCSSSSNNNWYYNQDGNLLTIGYQYKANKLVTISPNVRISNPDNTNETLLMGFICAKINL